ncbi:Aste57867_21437 [Aphanomyces stellatus]|uniref:Aste57867_21437 protein n=1 Tax=Aphanomyces stellatus TaxID=120398 RepID=A0A485LHG5_9STRA|nr:hypothetical protein As57867_021368 [Aphanomyces stellatus]VFT98108.1 Aste57867_21437 [Aphanomyces stellatus]
MTDAIATFTAAGLTRAKAEGRLFVTLTYAQSLDGSIAAVRGQPTLLSGAESMTMTHQLRVMHAGILVGVGTITADNPSLTARLVEGPNPQPLIVDAGLTTPLTCKLFTHSACRKPWLLTLDADWDDGKSKRGRRTALEATGATVITCAPDARDPRHIDLVDAFHRVHAQGLSSVMVEGGASILASCLATHAKTKSLLDHGIITIAPLFIGGLKCVSTLLPTDVAFPRLADVQATKIGDDIVLHGAFAR